MNSNEDMGAVLNQLCIPTNSLRKNYTEPSHKEDESWKSLFGAWKDTDENLAALVREQRFSNREVPNFE